MIELLRMTTILQKKTAFLTREKAKERKVLDISFSAKATWSK